MKTNQTEPGLDVMAPLNRMLRKKKFEAAGQFLLQLDHAAVRPIDRLRGFLLVYRAMAKPATLRTLEQTAFERRTR